MEQKTHTTSSTQSTFISAILIICCAICGVSCSNIAQTPSSERTIYIGNDEANRAALAAVKELQEDNAKHARELFTKLYKEYKGDFSEMPDNPFKDTLLGAQVGYYAEPGTKEVHGVLVRYGRVWAYDAGIGLSLAVHDQDPTAYNRALWLLKNGHYIQDPANPEDTIFAGWPFSMNLAHLGDDWEDQRFVTGANTYALIGIAEYLASDAFKDLDSEVQRTFLEFFAEALEGILYHFEKKGPNEDLVTAGWSLNALDEFAETQYSYYEMLDIVGYREPKVDGYSKVIERTRSKNVVTEHCNDVLKLLNFVLDEFDSLLGFEDAPYTYKELNTIRLKLRKGIMDKLFNKKERRMITGRTAAGVQSRFTAIDNASWLALSIDSDELNAKQIKMLSDSLVYTIANFTADFEIDGEVYLGTHYFPDGFEDPYIGESESFSSSYHMEATCGMICGLLEFANAFPDDPNAPFFRDVAVKLWVGMQHFADDLGFIYASGAETGVFEEKDASVSTIWYLMTLKYFKEDA